MARWLVTLLLSGCASSHAMRVTDVGRASSAAHQVAPARDSEPEDRPVPPVSQSVEASNEEVIVQETSCPRVFRPIAFDEQSAIVGPDLDGVFDQIASLIEAHPAWRLEIHGHAASGERRARALSLRRANAVRTALVERGVDENRLSVRGFGDDRPYRDEGTSDAQARNRRVHIVVLPQPRE